MATPNRALTHRPRPSAKPRPPAGSTHLCIGQHDVLDARRPPGLGALHAHVVDLVAADLAVLPAGRRRAPQHADGRGIERLRLHLPRRRAGHWQGQDGWGGREGGAGGLLPGGLACPPMAAAAAVPLRDAMPGCNAHHQARERARLLLLLLQAVPRALGGCGWRGPHGWGTEVPPLPASSISSAMTSSWGDGFGLGAAPNHVLNYSRLLCSGITQTMLWRTMGCRELNPGQLRQGKPHPCCAKYWLCLQEHYTLPHTLTPGGGG